MKRLGLKVDAATVNASAEERKLIDEALLREAPNLLGELAPDAGQVTLIGEVGTAVARDCDLVHLGSL